VPLHLDENRETEYHAREHTALDCCGSCVFHIAVLQAEYFKTRCEKCKRNQRSHHQQMLQEIGEGEGRLVAGGDFEKVYQYPPLKKVEPNLQLNLSKRLNQTTDSTFQKG